MTTTQDKTRHTSGPWRVGKHDETLGIYDMAENYRLATIEEWRGEHGEESEANARLIAAAPELLDALRRITHPMASDEDLTHALSVIAKAEGRGNP